MVEITQKLGQPLLTSFQQEDQSLNRNINLQEVNPSTYPLNILPFDAKQKVTFDQISLDLIRKLIETQSYIQSDDLNKLENSQLLFPISGSEKFMLWADSTAGKLTSVDKYTIQNLQNGKIVQSTTQQLNKEFEFHKGKFWDKANCYLAQNKDATKLFALSVFNMQEKAKFAVNYQYLFLLFNDQLSYCTYDDFQSLKKHPLLSQIKHKEITDDQFTNKFNFFISTDNVIYITNPITLDTLMIIENPQIQEKIQQKKILKFTQHNLILHSPKELSYYSLEDQNKTGEMTEVTINRQIISRNQFVGLDNDKNPSIYDAKRFEKLSDFKFIGDYKFNSNLNNSSYIIYYESSFGLLQTDFHHEQELFIHDIGQILDIVSDEDRTILLTENSLFVYQNLGFKQKIGIESKSLKLEAKHGLLLVIADGFVFFFKYINQVYTPNGALKLKTEHDIQELNEKNKKEKENLQFYLQGFKIIDQNNILQPESRICYRHIYYSTKTSQWEVAGERPLEAFFNQKLQFTEILPKTTNICEFIIPGQNAFNFYTFDLNARDAQWKIEMISKKSSYSRLSRGKKDENQKIKFLLYYKPYIIQVLRLCIQVWSIEKHKVIQSFPVNEEIEYGLTAEGYVIFLSKDGTLTFIFPELGTQFQVPTNITKPQKFVLQQDYLLILSQDKQVYKLKSPISLTSRVNIINDLLTKASVSYHSQVEEKIEQLQATDLSDIIILPYM